MAHGSIKKTSTGKYKVNFEFGYDENGNRIRKNTTYSTEKEAEIALSRHNTRMEDGIAVRPVQIKLCEWLDYWMENIIYPRTEDTTQYGYRNIINTHLKPELGNKKLQSIKPMDIQKYYTHLAVKKGLSPNSILKHHHLLMTAFKAAVRQEYITRNPIDAVEPPKKKKPSIKYYSASQVRQLFNKVQGNRLETFVTLCTLLGLRREEACGLKWVDIDFENRTVVIRRARTTAGSKTIEKEPKTDNSVRTLYISDALYMILNKEKAKQDKNRKLLGELYHDNEYVCAWPDGRPYRPNYLSELFTKFIKDNGLPKITLHGLRHTFASLSHAAGISAFDIGKAMGHSTPDTTQRIYTHLFDETHTATIEAVEKSIQIP